MIKITALPADIRTEYERAMGIPLLIDPTIAT